MASCQPQPAGGPVNLYYVAAIWLTMALVASLISIRVAIPVALVEIVVGALAGNIPGLREYVVQTPYTTFLASIGSVLLTFLAGAEIDPVSLRRHWKASLSIGVVSFPPPAWPWRSASGRWAGICTQRRSAAWR
jgi:Kef-type K+ transport system membrane component KefB